MFSLHLRNSILIATKKFVSTRVDVNHHPTFSYIKIWYFWFRKWGNSPGLLSLVFICLNVTESVHRDHSQVKVLLWPKTRKIKTDIYYLIFELLSLFSWPRILDKKNYVNSFELKTLETLGLTVVLESLILEKWVIESVRILMGGTWREISTFEPTDPWKKKITIFLRKDWL